MVLVKACSGCINTWKPLHSDLAYSPKEVAVLSCSPCLHTILKEQDRLCPVPQLTVAEQRYRNKQWTCSNQVHRALLRLRSLPLQRRVTVHL